LGKYAPGLFNQGFIVQALAFYGLNLATKYLRGRGRRTLEDKMMKLALKTHLRRG